MMYRPFKDLPVLKPTDKKNFIVLKFDSITGILIKTLMVSLTQAEAVNVARAGNRWFAQKGVKAYLRVKEERTGEPK